MSRLHRRYVTVFLATVGFGLVAAGLFNLLVDPFGAYRLVQFDTLSPYYRNEYVATAEKYESSNHRTVFVGSSRVLDGFKEDIVDEEGSPIFRMAVRGTSWNEQVKILNYLLDHSHLPAKIVFGLDLDTLLRKPRPSDFSYSRFNPDLRMVDYHGQNLFSIYALRESFSVLRGRWLKNEEAQIDTIVQRLGSQKVFTAQLAKDVPKFPVDQALSSIPLAMNELEVIFERAKQKGVTIKVVLLPIHALAYEKLLTQGYGDFVESLKRSIVSVCDVRDIVAWDFTGFTVATTETIPSISGVTMQWFYDSDHFTPRLGELVLAHIAGHQAYDWNNDSTRDGVASKLPLGQCIGVDNIEEHLARHRSAREDYLRRAHQEVTLIKTTKSHLDSSST